MLKYAEAAVVMAEVPDEITLAINIAGCPVHCPDCHSKYLWDNVGDELTSEKLHELIDKNFGVTCVAFMGGDQSPTEVCALAFDVKCEYDLKTAWYSGHNELPKDFDLSVFNYIKLGPYDAKYGPINKRTTNQKFYEVCLSREVDEGYNPTYGLRDITERFWKDAN